ncbi:MULTISPECIES: HofP DNA utilization family protein [Pantoea]|uniref:HofP DNA utilization family protein n=1 Tax=Pantoea TaxID=53335 RepID=UPI0028932296|nr:HofP DNA utilization family protein [Pantoea sp. UBA5923]
MRAKCLLLWLSTASLYAAPRDPFQPLASSLCVAPTALTGWRLQGVLGRAPALRAWLVSPQGTTVKIAPAAPLPLSGWRLSAIAPRSLTLTTGSGCSPQMITLSLKGSAYAQDDTFSAGEPLADADAGE